MSRSLLALARSRVVWVPVILVAACALAVRGSWADLTGPTANDRQVTRLVVNLLKEEHLSRHGLDDEISQRCLTQFLKTLDASKIYFYQSDVDQFSRQKNNLDNMLQAADTSFAYEVFNTYLVRLDERMKWIDEFLAQEQNFDVDEEMWIDNETAKYAKNEAEGRDLWRKRLKYELLVRKADGKTGPEVREKLSRRYHSFAKQMHQTDRKELLEMFLSALTMSYDPHTQYMAPASANNFDIVMSLHLQGIGAALQVEDGYTIVGRIIRNGPADKDGRLKKNDRIIGVGEGDSGPLVDVVDMKLSDVVDKIRGKRATTVRLQVIPAGATEKKEYKIVRDEVKLTDSEARGEIIEEKRGDRTFRIGAIKVPSFYMDMEGARRGEVDYKSVTRDCNRLLAEFRAKQVDAVIMDLRNNGGGSLPEAVHLTGLFIDQGPVVQVKDKDNVVDKHDDTDRGTAWDGPLVVMVNKFSASASEIFAGAIQDYGRGIVVGDKTTHGKGTVQSLLDLGHRLFYGVPNAPQLGDLKITMQQFYRPNGESTQKRGVVSDIELPSLTSHLDVGEGDLDYAMNFDRVAPAQFKRVNMVDKTMVGRLIQQSEERRKTSPDFQKMLKNIDRYEEQKSRKTVTLNEKKFMEERAEINAEKALEKEAEEQENAEAPTINRNYYFNEALAITLDYVSMLPAAPRANAATNRAVAPLGPRLER